MTFRMDPIPEGVRGGFVAGDTLIALMDGSSCTIADVVEQLHNGVHRTTYALHEDGTVQAVQVHTARREEGDAPVVAVTLDDQSVVHCSPTQLFLAPTGEWVQAKALRTGSALLTVVDPHLWSGKGYDPDLHARTDGHRKVVSVAADGSRALYEFQIDRFHNVAHPSGVFLHD